MHPLSTEPPGPLGLFLSLMPCHVECGGILLREGVCWQLL